MNFCLGPIPDTLNPKPLRPKVSFEFVRVDFLLHRVEELGPRVGLELGDELAGFPGSALRTGEVSPFLAEFVEDLEDMGALDAFVIVQGHGKQLRAFRDSGFGNRGSGRNHQERVQPDA